MPAFNGDSGGYVETWVDLGGYAGSNIKIRFRMATDGLEEGLGWYVDDVRIYDNAIISNEACVTSTEGDQHCDSIKTAILPSSAGGAPDISLSPGSLAALQQTNQTTSKILNIKNIGTSNLIWNIEYDSTGDCINPDNNVPWVGVLTAGDTTVPGSKMPVSVEFDSAGLSDDDYSGYLCIDSNDPVTPVEMVAVTLTVIPAPIPIHVADLDQSSTNAGRGKWNGHVDVLVQDSDGYDIENAVVYGSWSNGAIYDQPANHDQDGDSDGTAITIIS